MIAYPTIFSSSANTQRNVTETVQKDTGNFCEKRCTIPYTNPKVCNIFFMVIIVALIFHSVVSQDAIRKAIFQSEF